MVISPAQLVLARNEIARQVVARLTSEEAHDARSVTFKPTGTLDNMYQAVAQVDLGDGFYVDVFVQPGMDADPQSFTA